MSDEIHTVVERGVTAEPPAQRTPDGPARAGGGPAMGKYPISTRELHYLKVEAGPSLLSPESDDIALRRGRGVISSGLPAKRRRLAPSRFEPTEKLHQGTHLKSDSIFKGAPGKAGSSRCVTPSCTRIPFLCIPRKTTTSEWTPSHVATTPLTSTGVFSSTRRGHARAIIAYKGSMEAVWWQGCFPTLQVALSSNARRDEQHERPQDHA